MIKHSIAMADFDFARGDDIIQSMIGIGSIDDSIIVNLRTKEAITKYMSGVKPLNEVSDFVDANCHLMDNKLMSESLNLKFIEVLIEHDLDAAKIRFSQLTNQSHSLVQILQYATLLGGGYYTRNYSQPTVNRH